ncbi:hypothetical protein R615_04495 [Thalassolituus oleivorans R6-15]|nr:hypothetical protein R615_04495 [Thalassolituus oleivorans R6-15]
MNYFLLQKYEKATAREIVAAIIAASMLRQHNSKREFSGDL